MQKGRYFVLGTSIKRKQRMRDEEDEQKKGADRSEIWELSKEC